jgi:hypothetical protein
MSFSLPTPFVGPLELSEQIKSWRRRGRELTSRGLTLPVGGGVRANGKCGYKKKPHESRPPISRNFPKKFFFIFFQPIPLLPTPEKNGQVPGPPSPKWVPHPAAAAHPFLCWQFASGQLTRMERCDPKKFTKKPTSTATRTGVWLSQLFFNWNDALHLP